jgi:hypothetical protein
LGALEAAGCVMATLTLIDGDAQQAFEEHPTEIARKALMAAAEVETDGWPELLRRSARALPKRGPILKRSA